MSPRTPEENARMREESRARIMDAALRLFAHEGYAGTSVRRIADEAGVATGLLYRYFEGKEGLLRALFEHSMADVRASFAAAEAAPVPEERLAALIRSSFRTVREHQTFWRLTYGVRMQAAVLEGLGEGLGAWTREVRSTLERYLREAGLPAPEVEAALLFALIDGVSQHYVLEPELYPLEEVVEGIVGRYGARR